MSIRLTPGSAVATLYLLMSSLGNWQEQPVGDSAIFQLGVEETEPNFLLPEEWGQPLWRSLLANLADTVSPRRLPPLQLMSRPIDVGMLLGDRIRTPWYRTVFTNIGDVLSPEVLPPLELESRPVEVGELVADQLSHLWFTSLLRSLADTVAPERLPALQLSSKPDLAVLPEATMLLPRWSSVIDGPKVFYPDPPKLASSAQPPVRVVAPPVPPPQPPAVVLEYLHDMHSDLRRDISHSRWRVRLWMGLAAAQMAFLLVGLFWHW
jgi:hypothetical protein